MSARPALRLVQNVVDDNGELAGCPNCRQALEEAETWERRVLELEAKVRRLEEDKDAKARQDKDYPAAAELFDEWRRETGHPNARFDGDIRRVQRALRVIKLYRKDREKLSWVIQYGKHLAYVDERGVKHDSWGLLFRDADHIEKYANAWYLHCRRKGVTP